MKKIISIILIVVMMIGLSYGEESYHNILIEAAKVNEKIAMIEESETIINYNDNFIIEFGVPYFNERNNRMFIPITCVNRSEETIEIYCISTGGGYGTNNLTYMNGWAIRATYTTYTIEPNRNLYCEMRIDDDEMKIPTIKDNSEIEIIEITFKINSETYKAVIRI